MYYSPAVQFFQVYVYFEILREFYGQPQKVMEVKHMDTIALILSIIGSLNWGLVGIFQFDLVAWLFGGQDAILSRIVYALVGLAGLWCISLLFRKGQHAEME
jgi:uncharacterized membrane protein YuzA (DUF378 family)